ncbi:MAG: hypothetical protein O9325_07840 [Roseomonas sp.]|nr:hypothetical protein [Roseomonas sp.]
MNPPPPSVPPLREALECPHCGEPTLPNALADGSLVCSCAAERLLAPLVASGSPAPN